MNKPVEEEARGGGIAQYFVEHRDVGWMVLIAVLLGGAIAYSKLGQQEDPTIPQRTAMLLTQFPGATAAKVEELVSKPMERKISELKSIEEIKTQSRSGISILTIKQIPAPTATIDQEWDKVRAKLQEVELPQGAQQPWLNTDFGNTITLLFALVSPPITEAECVARANLVRDAQRWWYSFRRPSRKVIARFFGANSKQPCERPVLRRMCGLPKDAHLSRPMWRRRPAGPIWSGSLRISYAKWQAPTTN